MDFVNVNLNNMGLDGDFDDDDDDLDTICLVKLFTCCNRYKKCKAYEKRHEKVINITWHPLRWWNWDWCIPEDEKKRGRNIKN